MGVTAKIRWATAPAIAKPTNFTLELYADGAGQSAFGWELTIRQQTSGGMVPVRTFTGNSGALGAYARNNVSLQHTFPEAGNYDYAVKIPATNTKIGSGAFKVSAPYALIQKLTLNDDNWQPNELPSIKCTNFGLLAGDVTPGDITVFDGGAIDPVTGQMVYTRTRTAIPDGQPPFTLAGGASKTLVGPALGLLPGYVEIHWPITCPQDTVNTPSPVILIGRVA